MATLKEEAKEMTEYRMKSLREALEVEAFINTLPDYIQEIETGTISCGLSSTSASITYGMSWRATDEEKAEQAERIMEEWRNFGIDWELKPRCSSYSGAFSRHGTMQFRDRHIEVIITSLPQPSQCELIEKKEMREITVYEAICAEGTEPVKLES